MPWELGPAPGRYLVRAEHRSQGPPEHVLVIGLLGTVERRRLERRRPAAEPEPEPIPVPTARATIIDVGQPLPDLPAAEAWLRQAGEPELQRGLQVLERALHAHRLVMADPYVAPVGRRQLLVARAGYGEGEQVADGRWQAARELRPPREHQPRQKVLQPQARLAALLAGREPVLACEELALRARLDFDNGRDREAALGLLVALDAALAELPVDAGASAVAQRLPELEGQREPVAQAAQAALSGGLAPREREAVDFTLRRIEAALRARAVARA